MVNETEKAASVDENKLQAGFADAMARVEQLKLDPKSTLVDSIEPDKWAKWDASDENPMLIDQDGIDGPDFDDGEILHAA